MLVIVPLGMIVALLCLVQVGRQLQFRTDRDLIFAVAEELGPINSLIPLRGAERQIESLVFDRLFRLDDELVLRAGLAQSWNYHQHLSFFFSDEKVAEKAEAHMLSLIAEERSLRPSRGSQEVSRVGMSLMVSFSAYDSENAKELMGFLTDFKYLPLVKIRLSMKDAVRESWADFKKNSEEKGLIKREWIEGNKAVVLFVAGDVEQFLKELRLYYESNLNLDPKIEIVSQAAYLDVAEWVMNLRKGVSWHDGQPFTAADVMFSYEELTRPFTASPLSGDFSHVASLRVVGAHQLAVQCREYYAPIAESWQRLPILPAHLLDGKKTANDWQEFFQQPVGTGAFVFERRNDRGGVELKQNRDYFSGAPQQELMKFEWVDNASEREIGMRTGSFDGLRPRGEVTQGMRGDARFQVLDDAYRKQTLVAWNLQRPVFQREELRQALAHLVNVSLLLDNQGDEGLRLCRGIFYPGSWFCKKQMNLPEWDLEKARALLQQAGWELDEEGRWKDSSGEFLVFKLLFDQDSPYHKGLAEFLQRTWQANGIGVDLEPLAWTELVNRHLQRRDFDAALVSWDLNFGRDQYRVWHSSESERGGGNIFALRSGSVDRILQALKTERDAGAVTRLAENLQDQIQQIQPCLFLTESAESLVLRKGAVRLAHPEKKGGWSDGKLRRTPAGLKNEWRWWKRN